MTPKSSACRPNLFDHLVGVGERVGGDSQAERISAPLEFYTHAPPPARRLTLGVAEGSRLPSCWSKLFPDLPLEHETHRLEQSKHPDAYCAAPGATRTGVRGARIECDKQRRQRSAMTKAMQQGFMCHEAGTNRLRCPRHPS
jgi:hypothetical protein